MAFTEKDEKRFWSKVGLPDENGCMNWLGSGTPPGYGQIGFGKRKKYVHRVSYELRVGPIPEGLQIDHLCRNRACVAPVHLEAVTQKENLERGVGAEVTRLRHASRTHCKHGHEFTPENTRMYDGYRVCRECRKISDRKRYMSKKGS